MFFKGMKDRAFQSGFERGVEVGRADQRLEHTHSRMNHEHAKKSYYIGRPVIVIPNEWEDPLIGFGTRISTFGECEVLMVDDLFEGKEMFIFGEPLCFSEQKLLILSRLDPFERWAIHANNAVGSYDVVKDRLGQAHLGQGLIDFVHQSPFWEKWLAFKDSGRM